MGKSTLAMLAGEGAQSLRKQMWICCPKQWIKLNEQIKYILNTSKSERKILGKMEKYFTKKTSHQKLEKKNY